MSTVQLFQGYRISIVQLFQGIRNGNLICNISAIPVLILLDLYCIGTSKSAMSFPTHNNTNYS